MALNLRNMNNGLARFIKTQGKKLGVSGTIYVLQQQLTRRGKKRAVFFPGLMQSGDAGDLRGVALAEALGAFGWRVIVAPHWLALEQRRKLLRAEKPDVILFQ